ncbi:MAG: hypothetical protein ACE3L7_31990 [Candidatus Pristimantibacillus sp.]
MSEEMLRDRLSKVMAERRAGGIQPSIELPEASNTDVKPVSSEVNTEWKAFYEAIRVHVTKMRE